MPSQLVSPDEISKTLAKYKPHDLIEVLTGLRPLVQQNPAQARAILEQNSDLTYAILQALFLMGLVDETVIVDAMKASHISPSQLQVTNDNDNGSNSGRSTPNLPSKSPSPAPQTLEEKLQALDPAQATMIRQVLTLTEDQINSLPEAQQQQVRNLKSTYS